MIGYNCDTYVSNWRGGYRTHISQRYTLYNLLPIYANPRE
nr:MAG TPA: hypothetical protein [Caudoviricetes sp.]